MNATEVSIKIKCIIDDLWAQEISNQDAKAQITELLDVRENRLKVFRGDEKSAVFVRIMGVKRLKAFDKLLSEEDV